MLASREQIKDSYRRILKASTLIGGASAVNMVLGAVRNKLAAVLLGPAGVGLMGVYDTIASTAGTLAGFGIGSSAVREIVEADETGDSLRIRRVVASLRRITTFFGVIGTVGVAFFSLAISNFTFDSPKHAWPIAILAVTVFFRSVSGGQIALVQGMRRIGDLSRVYIVGGLLTTAAVVPLFLCLGQRSIVPVLLAYPLATLWSSWWYARKVSVERLSLAWREVWVEGRSMIRMGLAFVASSVLTGISGYIIRVLIVRELGLGSVGQYQAAFALASVYAGFVLGAMGADFYPRLTAMAQDNPQCNRLVNEQSEVALLLVGPGILLTLAFAPIVIRAFYSASFEPAIALLRWFTIGLLFRVISWPLTFIFLAKGLASLYMWAELVSNIVYVGFVFLGVHYFGLFGTALAFIGYYAFYVGLIAVLASKITGFRWSQENLCYGGSVLGASVLVLISTFAIKESVVAIVGSAAALAFGVFSMRRLSATLHGTRWGGYLARIAPRWLYCVPSESPNP